MIQQLIAPGGVFAPDRFSSFYGDEYPAQELHGNRHRLAVYSSADTAPALGDEAESRANRLLSIELNI